MFAVQCHVEIERHDAYGSENDTALFAYAFAQNIAVSPARDRGHACGACCSVNLVDGCW